MTIIEKLDTALSGMSLPCYPAFYEGDGTEYIAYDSLSDSPDVFGDNLPEIETNSGVVNLFVKSNPQKKKNKCRRLLREAGFLIGSVYEQYEADTGYTHFSIEFENYETINSQEELSNG